uniref:NADH-ubiquinone oxidoreductase chain 5 n=1 Tax=Proechimys brevicauda TaxID=2025600 RepID=A0A343IUJ0_9HYST|nr:NADH dehydrogenase subunit 5 [Proechimys brevicauda]AST23861.1 NADH dehydrogenase subunit 5 [Proechimys brevicauda]AST24043.1 NADH dehydrogenase subunit 5 [Proechimys brevicauda]
MNMFTSTFILTLVLLTLPILSPMTNFHKKLSYPYYVKIIISLCFFLSLIPTTIMFYYNHEAVTSNWNWLTIQTMNLNFNIKLDYFSILFMSVALFVTWSIMEFSLWYMHSDPHMNKFFKYLLLFLITMMILVTANNLFQLFIGWEGVGIMSFLLIGWWYGRSEANTAAMQAILYNRIGDIGFIMSMSWFILKSNSWELQQIFMTHNENYLIPMLGLLMAATGKSAQFGLHPWLPSAMEGPTPVSALLHSSTMVVAGIFLLIRFYPIIQNNETMLTMCLCMGAITTLFTAICAITQNDIKKIVAFSTSSQLGLMMVTIGINQPHMAFLHICTHAFFKAMLFLCSGSIIHNLNDEQDIRKMGGLHKTMPITSSSLMIGSLALTGTPFLTGFYSKDLIIESAVTSYTNAWALTATLIATSLTAVYSTRIIFFVLLNNPRFNFTYNMNEKDSSMINPIKRLAVGSIMAGFFMTYNIPITNIPQMTMTQNMKTMALSLTILGFAIAMELNLMTKNLKINYSSKSSNFSNMLGYFPMISHRIFPYTNLLTGQNLAFSTVDSTWLEKITPKHISTTQMKVSMLTSTQMGMLKLYFLSFFITMTLTTILMI